MIKTASIYCRLGFRAWLGLALLGLTLPGLGLIAPQAGAEALDFEARRINLAMSQEPPDLNSITSTDAVSGLVLDHVLQGLMTYNQQRQLVGGVAERWQLRDDGATFWLRPQARWSDGRPVTAADFVFAWQQAVAPGSGSEYAFILFPIRNAQAINRGQMPVTELGVKAIDAHTLEVQLHQPCPYFLDLTAFRTYYPLRSDFYQAQQGKYGAEAANLLFNGPFMLTEWIHGASLKMQKNPHYWDRASIWLEHIDVPYITEDPNAHMNLYRDQKIAMVDGLGSDSLEGALQSRMQIKSFLDGAIFYLEFNHVPGRVTANRHLRKAIQSVLNTDDLVYKVIGSPGTHPAYTIFPRWMQGHRDLFTREYPPSRPVLDAARGRHYMELARQELGLAQLPAINLLADDSPGGQKVTQFLQTLLQQSLGLEVRVDMQIFKQRLAKMSAGDFDLVIAGWGPDYNDLLTYGDLFYSENMNNRGRYNSADYDHWVRVAQASLQPELRMQAFAAMQDLLFEDVIVVPLYERGRTYVQHPRLQGVVRRAIGGDPNFNYARIVAPLDGQP
ncbi:MAG: peptide ABC transporter substrate-binding protein [Gammaproteobacteria bacterium]|uniref:peptide ABC transporter substrate-binding protein n=1 Tax=Pseudomaricurvus alcaniphilus TaxID=1166482 RepID=UPI0014089504|nr:peptide ABC transporter substrate-binding protein [Pseudomaricurvus alcaniphilus]MBR9912915.1 peptide ABC transporter substrate-binding protein [Gammaproteobacteria bacterium]NHN38678.1 peptide ABC transporter substrate-binding protein [Pseudomaricurvus alcaniphilus]